MSSIITAFEQMSADELDVLKSVPPTEESIALAIRLGKMIGSLDQPEVMVRQCVADVAERQGWPEEVSTIVGRLSYEGMQRGYFE